ncbi:bifunctional DNA-binding transcriptional regulator/O6-methylguanine-DNA methyltransferase Ada [Pseudomonas sp. IC_126]|uniref:bifunctional DNA-binding transcriptional regulator/O6-methylguanine-DNA methyltransferase Ada n=1 Tax=Pseudomonas sp. IC_126 TaxID=2547400 RepID=UPI001040B7A0|nr:bifunctional DNA-binding transcriptional regulator/O6-methylguanine-DNA methyltransferase Ada [Pseudomonas sp. IC_126]TCD22931.1 bifunctional DNA-binding transcriptional regulator/O6-methylguanine-DNA methyltransferase Ada [Pseudomonas sp. IC_126]
MIDFDRCWQALSERDADFDGRFVFAVRSTGIFCRPSCPARRPRRDGVSFFSNSADAEAAGYRACKRCAPHGQSPTEQLDALVIAACRLLDENSEPMTLDRLAARIGLSTSHLARAFKARTGLTPHAWAAARRRERLEAQLPGAESVLGAALESGYGSTRGAYQDIAALSPAQRRRKGAGEALRYAISPCPLGLLLVAASDKGICALLFADEEKALLDELQSRFAAAELTCDQAGLGEWLRSILEQLQEPTRAALLPLDLRGTAFQQRVWQALQNIPAGETRRYGELAASLGTHARAVARACASNPIGLLVPCHRVVGANQALTGYRWGIERKTALLESERGKSGA